MPTADDFAELTAPGAGGLYRWEAYDPANKVDLCASAVAVKERLFFVDPIPLAKAALAEMLDGRVPAGIVVTNGNHARAAETFRRRHQIPLALTAAAATETGLEPDEIIPAEGGPVFDGSLEAVPVPGGANGEVALYRTDDGGVFIVGDVIINLPSFPFALLPDKYCANPKLLRRSVQNLLQLPFSKMLFAHGEPLLQNAHARLAALVRNLDKP